MPLSDVRLGPMSIKLAVPVILTDRDVALIVKALTVESNPLRLSLLPEVLREWAEVDLVEYASAEASRASIPAQIVRYARVLDGAKELIDALDAVTEADDLVLIGLEMGRAQEAIPKREQREHFGQKLKEHHTFLRHLIVAVESLQKRQKKGRGRPRNIAAYRVLLDIAAIFKWLTGLEPNRVFDSIAMTDAGAFYNFAAAIWPPVFACGLDGLGAAMKNWAFAHREYEELPLLLTNINLRHPSWRVFDR